MGEPVSLTTRFASQIAPYHDAAASEVAQRLDTEVLTLLREAAGAPASGTT